MNVILLEKVHNLGNLGDQVNVKAGYGRNFLIPKGIAVTATGDNIAKFEARRAELEKVANEKVAGAEARKTAVEAIGTITIAHNAGDEGKLFGSVGTTEIANAITEAGAKVTKREVRLPNGVIRAIGEFEIDIELHADVIATVKINVIPE